MHVGQLQERRGDGAGMGCDGLDDEQSILELNDIGEIVGLAGVARQSRMMVKKRLGKEARQLLGDRSPQIALQPPLSFTEYFRHPPLARIGGKDDGGGQLIRLHVIHDELAPAIVDAIGVRDGPGAPSVRRRRNVDARGQQFRPPAPLSETRNPASARMTRTGTPSPPGYRHWVVTTVPPDVSRQVTNNSIASLMASSRFFITPTSVHGAAPADLPQPAPSV